MSVAARTRRAADRHPFLVAALRAGVVNYTAAARYLEVDGDTEAVATALGRYAQELSPIETSPRSTTVRMQSGVGVVEEEKTDQGVLTVGGVSVAPDHGSKTAIIAIGDVDPTALATALASLSIEDIDPEAAAVVDGTMVVVVDRQAGVDALRAIEDALDRVPEQY